MAKSSKLEALTAELNQIRPNPTSENGLNVLSRVIASRYGIAVAQAARLVSEFEIHSLMPELAAAFDRFLVKAKDRDPGCRAKQAIADALYRLDYYDAELFLKGIRYVQWEPVWGGQVDTAPKLRGTCALGLVRMNYPAVMVELADLLADPEPEARIGAARAVAYSENPLGVALLRLRIKVGDSPTVLGECAAALLKLAATDTLPLIEAFLEAGRKESDSRESIETAEVMALVLGESRLPEALLLLQAWWQRTTHPELRQTGLLAIASLRRDEALEFLLQLLREGSAKDARAALAALELYRSDDFLWPRVAAILEQRSDLHSRTLD
ncbi:hypothetical protein C7271_17985 [filamentous cyanobacterium CCP5]|nr:hypothetical protein C7271_17985 [filamentous cyanobacterium CCP5]